MNYLGHWIMIQRREKKLIGVLETGTYFHNSINNLIRKTLALPQREIIFVKSITHKNLMVKFLEASPSSSQNTNRSQAWLKERKGHWNILTGGCCNQLFTVHPIICLILHISRLNKHVSYVHHIIIFLVVPPSHYWWLANLQRRQNLHGALCFQSRNSFK